MSRGESSLFAAVDHNHSVSTLADQVGAACHALVPLYRLIETDVHAAARLHSGDTTVPVMARDKTDTARFTLGNLHTARRVTPISGKHLV
ncbi:transposase [Acidiphilium multivorum AIU301]|nr:transposase [Acidiphilium multivorum AIU301]